MDYALKFAVENLLVAIDKEEVLDEKIDKVIEALGYDPRIVDKDFLVKLEIEVYTSTPSKAVEEFISMVKESLLTDWAYRVIDEDGNETIIEGWNLGK